MSPAKKESSFVRNKEEVEQEVTAIGSEFHKAMAEGRNIADVERMSKEGKVKTGSFSVSNVRDIEWR